MNEKDDRAHDGMDRPLKIPGSSGAAAALAKRFYDEVGVRPLPAKPGSRGDRLFAIDLDGRPVRTPAKHVVAVPSEALGEALAAEWRAQGERIDPRSMPLTRIVNSGLDGVAGREAEVAEDLVKFAGTDLLFYRAEHPVELVDRQARLWDPILDWASRELGVAFVVGAGVMHVAQEPLLAERFRGRVARFGPLELAALHVMTTISGSAIIAWATAAGRLAPEAAWTAAHVDEDWQIEQWGEDAEAGARRHARWLEFAAAAALVGMLR